MLHYDPVNDDGQCKVIDDTLRATINININSKLAGTTKGKNSFEGVVALKRAGLVLTFQTEYSARLQENAGLLVVVEVMYGWRDALLGGKDRSCFCPVKRVSWLLAGCVCVGVCQCCGELLLEVLA